MPSSYSINYQLLPIICYCQISSIIKANISDSISHPFHTLLTRQSTSILKLGIPSSYSINYQLLPIICYRQISSIIKANISDSMSTSHGIVTMMVIKLAQGMQRILINNKYSQNKLTYYHLKIRRCVQVNPLLTYCYSMYYNNVTSKSHE